MTELKKTRVEAIKAANAKLPDAYFTDERAQTWAEMAEEAFAVVLDGLTALAGEKTGKETAAFKGGDSPTSPSPASVGRLLKVRQGRSEN